MPCREHLARPPQAHAETEKEDEAKKGPTRAARGVMSVGATRCVTNKVYTREENAGKVYTREENTGKVCKGKHQT
jgi:hypothetical protein